jgi:hypothetical protein
MPVPRMPIAGHEPQEIDDGLAWARSVEPQAAIPAQEVGIRADREPYAPIGAGAQRLAGL